MATPNLRDAIRTMQRGPGFDEGWTAVSAASTDATGVVVKAAPGAGFRLVITDLIITNTGSAAGVTYLTETSAAGTKLAHVALGIGSTTPTQAVINLRKPIFLGENKSLWVYGYTNSSNIVTAVGYTIDINDIK